MPRMLTAEVVREVDSERWNSLVQSVPEGTFYQTTFRASFIKKVYGGEAIYVIVRDGREVLGILLIHKNLYKYDLFGGLPGHIRRRIFRALSPLIGAYMWTAGPLILAPDRMQEVCSLILKTVDDLAKTEGIICISGAVPPVFPPGKRTALDSVFTSCGYGQELAATFLLDLTCSIEDLWKNLHRGARKNLRKAERQGVGFREVANKEEFNRCWEIYLEECKRNRLVGARFNRDSLYEWRVSHEDVLQHFLAEIDGVPLAVISVVTLNGMMNEVSPTTVSRYAMEHGIWAGDVAKWGVIKWGQEKGLRVYDLAGVAPSPTTLKEEGIHRFKSKWHGEYVEYYAYGKVYRKRTQAAFRLLQRVKDRPWKGERA